jgi:signal peptidase II
MKNFKAIGSCIVISLLLVGCDRLTKQLAKDYLRNKEPISYLNNAVRLEYVENTGAFLSWGSDWSDTTSFWILTIFPLAVLLILFIVLLRRMKKLPFTEIAALLLIFSGGTGNLIDRMLYNRRVTDFISFGVGELRTGILNVADVYVTTGALLLMFYSIRKFFMSKKQQQVEN